MVLFCGAHPYESTLSKKDINEGISSCIASLERVGNCSGSSLVRELFKRVVVVYVLRRQLFLPGLCACEPERCRSRFGQSSFSQFCLWDGYCKRAKRPIYHVSPDCHNVIWLKQSSADSRCHVRRVQSKVQVVDVAGALSISSLRLL